MHWIVNISLFSFSFRAAWCIVNLQRRLGKTHSKFEYIFLFSASIEVGTLVNSGTSSNLSCNHNSKSASPSKKPLLVGIIILASMSFIIILLTLYTYRLEMNQQSTTKQKENIWTQIMFISETLCNEIVSNA